MTGMHTVADICCVSCNTVLGWKYVSPACLHAALSSARAATQLMRCGQEAAVEESQKYKEGKYILEKAKIMKVCVRSLSQLICWTSQRTSADQLGFMQEGTW